MSHRVLIPDTSVLVASFFDEQHTRAAQQLVAAIRRGQVRAFAPHAVMVEFLKTAAAKRARRGGREREDRELVEEQVERFLELPIVYVRETELGSEAWRLMTEERVSPPDSWMLACAIRIPESELWISHEHADGFVSSARALHGEVFTLATDLGRLP